MDRSKLLDGTLPVYKIIVTVKSMKGHCNAGYKVGDTIEIEHGKVSGIKCLLSLNAISPPIYMLRWGGQYPWSGNPPVVTQECPDKEIQVNFEIRRAGNDQAWHEYGRNCMRRADNASKK